MKLVLFLIKKLFISKNSSLVFRLTNFVTIISLSLGVASLNIVMSSIDGFESEISKKLSNLNGYSTINHLFEDEIMQNEFDQPFILDKVPYLEKVALLKSKSDSQGIIINAYPINDFNKIRLFKSFDSNKIKNESIVVGKRLADNLKLKLGDQVVIFNPKNLENFSNQNRYDFFTVAHIIIENEFKLISIEQNIYFVDYLPMEFSFSNSLLIIIISVILSFIISASSVKRFAYFNPMNVLRSK